MVGKAELPDLEEVQKNIVNRRVFEGDPAEYKPYEREADEPAILNPFFKGYRYHITGLHHGPTGFPTEDAKMCAYNIKRLVGKIQDVGKLDDEADFEEYMLDDAEVCIIAYGSISRGAKEAVIKLREDGIKAGLFRPIMLWPSPAQKIEEIGKRFEKIFVTELNQTGQYLEEIQRITGRKDFATLHTANGRPIAPLDMVAKVKEMF
jgi:2-oxoglutarate ferredoxin oxidoreductase subunit alpha